VQVAPRGGTLERLVPEGQAVRTGTPVVAVAGQPLRAERPGTLSYQVDGLEAELDPDALGWVTGAQATGPGPDWLQQVPFRRVEPPGNQVAAGEPVFKVVDNASLWLAVSGPARLLAGVNPGDPARVQFPALGAGSHRFRVVYKSPPQGDQVLLALAADSPIPDTLTFLRRTPARVVLGRWEGWVVPREALTVFGGRPGVLVRTPAGERFVPVTVLGQNETEAVVEGDLAPDAEVLVPPGDPITS
ncbi:MAG: HlyD family efflux transporter periplasmic adaptor subunit, partial [Bacillota bacterium]